MFGSVRIARIAGIDLFVHWTLLLVVAWVGWTGYVHYPDGQRWWGVLDGSLFVLAVFVCVALHEYGHAIAARGFGVPTRDITLLPIGGIARLEGMAKQPQAELVIAIAGPLVNVAISVVLVPIALLVGWAAFEFPSQWSFSSFPLRLLLANVILVVFNLLPAFPLDGGRVLRSLLRLFLSLERATQWVVGLGAVMAVFLALAAFFTGNAMLFLIALFVFAAGQQEARAVQQRQLGRFVFTPLTSDASPPWPPTEARNSENH